MHQVAPAPLMKMGRVGPLQALTTPGKASPTSGQLLSQSSLRGLAPCMKQGVMSARLRGLHPSTSPPRHPSVRMTCRALLPWVSFSRVPASTRRLRTSRCGEHPGPAARRQPRRADPGRRHRLSGWVPRPEGPAPRESTSKNTFNRLPREPGWLLLGCFHRSSECRHGTMQTPCQLVPNGTTCAFVGCGEQSFSRPDPAPAPTPPTNHATGRS